MLTITTPLLPEQQELDAGDYVITADENLEFLSPVWAIVQGPTNEEATGRLASVSGVTAVYSRTVINA